MPIFPRSFAKRNSIKARNVDGEDGSRGRIWKEPVPLPPLRDEAPLCNQDRTKSQEKASGKIRFANPFLSSQLLASLPGLDVQFGEDEDCEFCNEPPRRGTPDVARHAVNTSGPFVNFEDPNEGFSSRNSSPISIPSPQDRKEDDSYSTEEGGLEDEENTIEDTSGLRTPITRGPRCQRPAPSSAKSPTQVQSPPLRSLRQALQIRQAIRQHQSRPQLALGINQRRRLSTGFGKCSRSTR